MSSTFATDAARSAPVTRPLHTDDGPPASGAPSSGHLPWWHLALRAIKGLFLVAEFCAILMLAAYAGMFQTLPLNPPALHVFGPGHEVVARQDAYCWLTPGRAVCADSTSQDGSITALPLVTAPKGDTLRLTMAYPAPTHCTATTDAASGSGKPLTQGLASTPARALTSVTYRLDVAVQPGTYRVTIACQWAPRSTMRWLRGLGDSTYDIALRVVAH